MAARPPFGSGVQSSDGSNAVMLMRMRTVPKLNFHYDESVERGAHLSHLIDQAVEEDRKHLQDQSPRDDEAQG